MRQAFMLLGVMTCIVIVGAYFAFSKNAEAPETFVDTHTNTLDTNTTKSMTLTLSAPSFGDGELIPPKYTCDGENISPELHISGVPEGTQSLVLVMDDPDIPEEVKVKLGVEKFDHWTVYAIPPNTTVLPEGGLVGNLGLTTRGEAKYVGPCPPDREHRYFFRLYALSGTLTFTKPPTLKEVEDAARGMMLETVTLMGRYERIK